MHESASLNSDLFGAPESTITALAELIRRCQAEENLEQLERRIASREKFFALVCHDLRSPLAVIKMCADLLERLNKNSDSTPFLSRILSSVTRANGMLKDVLSAERLKAGGELQIKPAPCDLRQLAQKKIEDFSLIHGDLCRYEGDGPVAGRWDAELLGRAMENLISNAFKYGQSGAPVTVRIQAYESTAILSVHNFGNPLSAREIEGLFQWHGRTESAFRSENSGWGLGLMLVKGVAEAHGGSVRVASSREKGTVFTMEIPRDFRSEMPIPSLVIH